ncbi:GDP-Man:Man(3)GlcNAc(2)-PP-Dol alpha-1,2-mannosyltransferase [Porphyridium purpureum]|uniref:GDP-Man:Man(3)GlcNAc(2)-PP-Dol alpha-1,2-mannosyltransferase n=1 Tax=Porphyridium purpureum TaxID=35688 RepID=A0A5J4YSQ8_PORPP|nr:GDP-Man:Man(3)GlcNAc(2)-PP-Dol alpha-1,2-mannosyltransferase [Porphyridium purpureum]|eukprot:POR7588..scf229_5
MVLRYSYSSRVGECRGRLDGTHEQECGDVFDVWVRPGGMEWTERVRAGVHVVQLGLFVLYVSVLLGFGLLVLRAMRARQRRDREWLRRTRPSKDDASCAASGNAARDAKDAFVVSFLHPHALAGGGGERVLWLAIKALRGRFPDATDLKIRVFTKGAPRKADVLEKVFVQFGIDIFTTQFELRELWSESLLDGARYPFCTLLLQFLAGAIAGVECTLLHVATDLFIDTTGHAASLAVAKWLGGCHVATYVHYPTISTDMVHVVRSRTSQFNNSSRIADSLFLSGAKLAYYRLFSHMYGLAGGCADVVMVNSSWTRSHISSLWSGSRRKISLVFPPIDTKPLLAFGMDKRDPALIVSVAQFRPEKNHALQIEAFVKLLHKQSRDPRSDTLRPRLVMIGGCRNADDAARVELLLYEIQNTYHLRVPDQVELLVNVTRDQLHAYLAKASAAIHTMKDEHFGISVVEFQAAGVIAVAHNSGGVALDIIQNGKSGFLAETADQFADCLSSALSLNSSSRLAMIQTARDAASRYSDEGFATEVLKALQRVLPVD